MKQELLERYIKVPQQLKQMKRWVCYKVEKLDNGKTTKRPYNALNGSWAKVNDDLTWANFNTAIIGCEKYNCDGLGFVLGEGIFGIDLDNHYDENGNLETPKEEFKKLAVEFIQTLNSYTEISQGGNGIHIICAGKLPVGARRTGSIEMYDSNRFFAFTGRVINNKPVEERTKEVIPLWEKYVNIHHYNTTSNVVRMATPPELKMSDEEVIEKALASASGDKFYRYYHDGELATGGKDNSHSAADLAFSMMLAFWCNGDIEQMDRIFRNSGLMRDKWDRPSKGGTSTYGRDVLEKAILQVPQGYIKEGQTNFSIYDTSEPVFNYETNQYETVMNIDKEGNPIFRIKEYSKKHYSYSDTGNAERFYDYFGKFFKYNVTDKCYMFWTGKVWIRDEKEIIRKYANKFIEILQVEENELREKMLKLYSEGRKDEGKDAEKIYDACCKNTARVANMAGKNAMLNEFASLYDIPVTSDEFNKDDLLLNTDSGIVDLRTGKILPFDRNKLISKSTHCKVSFEKSQIWEDFLYSILDDGTPENTKAMIDSMQTCLGYSLSGSIREQVFFLLFGGGSNGKSTLVEQINHTIGDYGESIQSQVLMQTKNGNNSNAFSFAKLQTTRFLMTGETDEGNRLAEAQLKALVGGDTISAQFKFGNEFSFKPKFKLWMSTNYPPNIRGTDHGMWRRIIMFEFKKCFTEAEKDKDMPDKLKADTDKILGWCIQGYLKYQKANQLLITTSQRLSLTKYKTSLDNIMQFISKECTIQENSSILCKELYAQYKIWASNNTDFVHKESKFATELQNKGIIVERTIDGKNYYKGIRLNGTFTVRHKDKD